MNRIALLLSLVCICQAGFGQVDSLVLAGGKSLTGTIEKMERGVLEIDVPYGDENFKIKWPSVVRIYTETSYLVGIGTEVYQGRVVSDPDGGIRVMEGDSVSAHAALKDLVSLTRIKDGFSNRFSASFEFGLNIAKAQNLRQFSFRSAVGYRARKWSTDASYNIIRASQNEVEDIRRTDGLLNFRHLLFTSWYGIATIATLSNTEQLLDIRANSQLGVGHYLFNTNKLYWGVKTGVNNNFERFANDAESRNSWEGFLGTELNLYNLGDVDLIVSYMGYSGFTEKGRYRADANIDFKYDLPLDFFVRFGISLNYDNQPADNASETDYIIRTGIGWEW